MPSEPTLPLRRWANAEGQKSKSRRSIVNAVLYLVRAGLPWRYLPHDFPPWKTVYNCYRLWTQAGLWQKIHDELYGKERRRPSPSAAIIDSQSVQTGDQGGSSGFDAGKKTKGRKRHILVDSVGLILAVAVDKAVNLDASDLGGSELEAVVAFDDIVEDACLGVIPPGYAGASIVGDSVITDEVVAGVLRLRLAVKPLAGLAATVNTDSLGKPDPVAFDHPMVTAAGAQGPVLSGPTVGPKAARELIGGVLQDEVFDMNIAEVSFLRGKAVLPDSELESLLNRRLDPLRKMI